jgi:hypothetical protein
LGWPLAVEPRPHLWETAVSAVTWARTVIAACGLVALVAAAVPAAADPTKAVIELFTSQGCSSCPPADKLLGEYAQRGDVLALSYNVDYWDYLGWKDTLASHDNSERQRAYATSRGDRQVYTPQVVVDGREHVVGSNKDAIDTAILRNAPVGLPVPITMTATADATTVNIGAAPPGATEKGTIWLVMFDRTVTVPVERGENAGKTITYHNTVRKMRPIAMWKGKAMSVDLPKSELTQAGVRSCAVLLQVEGAEGLPGAILGAAAIEGSR